jgi:hypothetical protein
MLPHPVPLLDLANKQVAISKDRGQDVIEIMRDAACEPAHGFHLLRLQQLLLEPLSFGDIAGNRRYARHRSTLATDG